MKDTVNFFQTQCNQRINPKNAKMYCKDNSVDATFNHEDLSLENEQLRATSEIFVSPPVSGLGQVISAYG